MAMVKFERLTFSASAKQCCPSGLGPNNPRHQLRPFGVPLILLNARLYDVQRIVLAPASFSLTWLLIWSCERRAT